MTIEEAKELYMFCNGNEGYYMWHEAGEKETREYSALKISKEVKAEWDKEIIEKNLGLIDKEINNSSGCVSRILEALLRENVNPDEYADRFLSTLEKLMASDDMDKIHIISTMGEDRLNHISGCQYFCLHTVYGDKMNMIMQRFMDFEVPDELSLPQFPKSVNKQVLYKDAVEDYCRSYAKYGGRGDDAEERINQLCQKNCKPEAHTYGLDDIPDTSR